MPSERHNNYFYLSSLALILLLFTLLCGCVGTNWTLEGNNSGKLPVVDPATMTTLPNSTPPANQVAAEPPNHGNIEINNNERLEKAWKTLRIINSDTNERYLKLDLSKSDDVNYLRYLLVPETVQKIDLVRSDLNQVKPVNDNERNDTKILIEITNYTILKYEGLASVMHATQYVSIGDPIKMKAELRKAKFQIMDALDIINKREITQYPSMYRDQVAADKRELDDMASQVDSFTRSVYLNPLV
ncbi:MAG: hypothetical protein WCJ93_09565 [Methanomicrobiales archaeon]